MRPSRLLPPATWVLAAVALLPVATPAAVVSARDANLRAGLSPYNWVVTDHGVNTAVCGASLTVGFTGTRTVALEVDTSRLVLPATTRFPIIAWTVNGGPEQTRQLAAGDRSILLAAGTADPVIDLYVKGMCPWVNRYDGDPPPNSLTITGFTVDDGAATTAVEQPRGIWLAIGDSITSGDGAAYAEKQGRPKNDLWAESDDARASYARLVSRHFGYRDSRLAYGGYNWSGGLAKVPKLATLIDQTTSSASRLQGGVLQPPPDVVSVNLGTNGKPQLDDVVGSLLAVRKRAGPQAVLIVMVPFSGAAKAEVTAGFEAYVQESGDRRAHLVDLGRFPFATADGVHPTAAGHKAIVERLLPALEPIVFQARP